MGYFNYFYNMIRIESKAAIDTMKKSYHGISGRQLNAIAAKSINSAITKGRKEAIIATKSEYNIGARFQNNMIRTKRAKPTWPIGKIEVLRTRLPLTAFEPKETAWGVTVKIKSSRELIRGSFFGKMSSGHSGVFARGRYGKDGFVFRQKRIRKSGNDLNISELTTLGYNTMFLNTIEGVYNTHINAHFLKIMRKNMKKAVKGQR